jgi:hypothetical protein
LSLRFSLPACPPRADSEAQEWSGLAAGEFVDALADGGFTECKSYGEGTETLAAKRMIETRSGMWERR